MIMVADLSFSKYIVIEHCVQFWVLSTFLEVKKNAMQLIKQWKVMIRGGSSEIQDAITKRTREQPETKGAGEKPEKRAKLAGVDKGKIIGCPSQK